MGKNIIGAKKHVVVSPFICNNVIYKYVNYPKKRRIYIYAIF